MRRTVAAMLALSALSLEAREAEPLESAATREHVAHVRGTTDISRKVVADGMQRSPTIARLAAILNRSDVFVYVELAHVLPPSVEGQLTFLGSARSGQRYLRVKIRAAAPVNERLGLLGHELQHAVEVASAPDVRDEAGLALLYRRIGSTSRDSKDFETREARDAGRQVMAELWKGPAVWAELAPPSR